jgi:hypothetical protein
MKGNIKKILLEYIDLSKYKKLRNAVYSYLDYELSDEELEKDELTEEEKLETLHYMVSSDFNVDENDAHHFIFKYFMDKGEDPLEYIEFDTLRSRMYGSEISDIFEKTGWYDKYLKDEQTFPQLFNDVEKKGDKFYLTIDHWSEFTMLVNKNDQDYAERILGEDWAELYGYYDVDWSSDIVDNLDEESIKHIKDHIKEGDFIGQEMSEYSMGDGQFHTLTEDMVNDTDTILRLIGEESIFHELRHELASQYRWAYEQAGEDELFGNLKDSIEELLGSKGKWDDVKNKDGDITGQVIYFDITDIFYKYLIESLEATSEMPGEYYSDYISMLSEVLEDEYEELSAPDMSYFYPDSTKTEENFNYNIQENI